MTLTDSKKDYNLSKENQIDFIYDIRDSLGFRASQMSSGYQIKNGVVIRVKDHTPNWINFIEDLDSNDEIKKIINVTVGDYENSDKRRNKTSLEKIEEEYPNIEFMDIEISDGDSLKESLQLINLMIDKFEQGGKINGKQGGLLKGKLHSEGGIDAVVDGSKAVSLEGGEVIINRNSSKLFCKELSEINQAGGGVAIPCDGGTDDKTKFLEGGIINGTPEIISTLGYSVNYSNEKIYEIYKSKKPTKLSGLVHFDSLYAKYRGIGDIKVYLSDCGTDYPNAEMEGIVNKIKIFSPIKIELKLNFKYYEKYKKFSYELGCEQSQFARESILLHEIQHVLAAIHSRPSGTTKARARAEAISRIEKEGRGEIVSEELIEDMAYSIYIDDEGEVLARKAVAVWLNDRKLQYGKDTFEDGGLIEHENKETEVRSEEAPQNEVGGETLVDVKLFKKGDGGTKGVFEAKNGLLYKSLEPQEMTMTNIGIIRKSIKDAITDEYKILSELQDNTHIPKIGKIVNTTEGKSFEIERLDEIDSFTKDEYRKIQEILNNLNNNGYHVGDRVTIMKRPKTGELVVVDFSSGYKGDRMSRDADDYMQNIYDKLNKSDAIYIRQEDLAKVNRSKAKLFKNEPTTQYYLTRRPPSIGTHPTEGLKSIEESEYRGKESWKITYDKKLSADQVYKFELTPLITNKEYLGQKINGVFGNKSFYVLDIDYKQGKVTLVSELNGNEIHQDVSFIEFQKNIDNGKYKIEQSNSPIGMQGETKEEMKTIYDNKIVNNWDEIPINWKVPKQVKKVSCKSTTHSDKQFVDLLEPFTSKDQLRIAMTGIHYCDGRATATDGHRIVSIKSSESGDKILSLEGKVIDERFPDYKQVMDNLKTTHIHKVDLLKIKTYCEMAVIAYCNKTTMQGRFEYGGGTIAFNISLLLDSIEVFMKLGYSDIYVGMSEPNRGILLSTSKEYLSDVNKSEVYSLIMPVLGIEILGVEDLDFNNSCYCYYSFVDDEIHNADKSIVKFDRFLQEQYQGITKTQYNVLKSIMTNKPLVPILECIEIENNIATSSSDLSSYVSIKNINIPDGLYYPLEGALRLETYDKLEDYPNHIKNYEIGQFIISLDILKKEVYSALQATSDDKFKLALQGVFISTEEKEIRATSGYMAYRNKLPMETKTSAKLLLDGMDKFTKVAKYLEDQPIDLKTSLDGYNYCITMDDIEFKGRLIYNEVFPNILQGLNLEEREYQKIFISRKSIAECGKIKNGEAIAFYKNKISKYEMAYRNREPEIKDLCVSDIKPELGSKKIEYGYFLMPLQGNLSNPDFLIAFNYELINDIMKGLGRSEFDLYFYQSNRGAWIPVSNEEIAPKNKQKIKQAIDSLNLMIKLSNNQQDIEVFTTFANTLR